MKGFSLLEFVAATSLFLVIVLFGYQNFDFEQQLSLQILHRTRPEQESNYRLLVLNGLLRNCSEKLKQDPLLENVPVFFSDLALGKEAREDAFSIVRPVGLPEPFVKTGTLYRVPLDSSLQEGKLVAMAGATDEGLFGWNYAKVARLVAKPDQLLLKLDSLKEKPLLLDGSLIEVEFHGFLFRNQTLYWITQSGQTEPFFGPLEGFHYTWKDPQLFLFWETDFVSVQFPITL